MNIGEVWNFFNTEAVKPVVSEVRLTKAEGGGSEKDSMPGFVNNYLKKNAKNKQSGYKE